MGYPAEADSGLSAAFAVGPADLLSISRVALGALVAGALVGSGSPSYLVLPAVVLACLSDFFDGRVARSRGSEGGRGRFYDNLGDGLFLALAFWGFAETAAWSNPQTGRATAFFAYANWLPLWALGASFGAYMMRWLLAARRGAGPRRSPRGHSAGVANYILAVVGAVAVFPGAGLSPWLVEPAFLTVVLMNLSAAAENLMILFQGEGDG